MKIKLPSACVVATLVLSGCATAGGGSAFSMAVGLGSRIDVQQKVAGIFNREGYQIQRFDETRNGVYIETRWLERDVFPEERAGGAVEARTKFVLTGRTRGSNLVLQLRAQNEGRMNRGESWQQMASTPEYQSYARRIGNALRAELDTGVRTY